MAKTTKQTVELTEEQKKDVLKKRSKEFVRQDYNKKKRLKKKWRYPRGIHSKLRHRKKGYGIVVKTGYKVPKTIRHRTIDGYKIITIHNMNELIMVSEMSKEDKVKIQLSSTIGKKKRLLLLNKIKELKLNYYGSVDDKINKINNELKLKKTKKEGKKETKKETKKAEEKEKTKATGEKGVSEKGEKDEKDEKKEFDKLLTKSK